MRQIGAGQGRERGDHEKRGKGHCRGGTELPPAEPDHDRTSVPMYARTTSSRLTGSTVHRGSPIGPSELEQALSALNPDEMSPRDALEALYRLRALTKPA